MLLEQLLEDKKINEATLKQIKGEINNSNKTEEEILLKNKIISEKELFKIKSQILDIELVDDTKFSDEVLEFIPFKIAEKNKIIAIAQKGGEIHIGMVYPENQNAHEFIGPILKKRGGISKIYLISFSTLKKRLKEYKRIKEEVEVELDKIQGKQAKNRIKKVGIEKSILETAPVIKIVNVILEQAVDGGASDIHIEPGTESTRVRFRVMGRLYHSISLPENISLSIISRIKILANLKIDEVRRPQDGRFSTVISNRKIDFRVSTFPVQNKEKAVLRILDPEKQIIPEIKDLGFLRKEVIEIEKAVRKPYGLVLVSGPTGSGKTTTLLSILNKLNREDLNVVTIEDPIEYTIDGINQSQIRAEIGYTFASGLRSILRQDPDVIMVGEIRDKETAKLLVNAALTGHLVLSTLHTNNVVGIIPRLIDMGVDPFLIAPVFNIAMSQRLIKTLCAKCKEKKILSDQGKIIIRESLNSLFDSELKNKYLNLLEKTPYIYGPVGCLRCNKLGYSNRTAVTEILHINSEFATLITKGPTEEEIKQQTRKQQMITMQQNGMIKVLEGITTIEEVLAKTKKE